MNTFKHMRLIATYGLPVFWAVCLLLFLNATSPLQSGPFSVLLAFILIYLAVTSTLYAVAFTALKVARFLGWHIRLSPKTAYYLVSVIGLGPVFILALNTLGQIELKDVLFVITFLLVACFYVVKKNKKPAA